MRTLLCRSSGLNLLFLPSTFDIPFLQLLRSAFLLHAVTGAVNAFCSPSLAVFLQSGDNANSCSLLCGSDQCALCQATAGLLTWHFEHT